MIVESVRAAGAVVAIALVACGLPAPRAVSASISPEATASPLPDWHAAITPAILGGPQCRPPSQLVTITSGGLRPLLGTPRTGTTTRAVLALFLRPTVGVMQKMVLRMSGTGPVTINAFDEAGMRFAVTRIDSSHGVSSYDPIFPGTNEWGAHFTFLRAGCWRLEVLRADAAADFYIEVSTT